VGWNQRALWIGYQVKALQRAMVFVVKKIYDIVKSLNHADKLWQITSYHGCSGSPDYIYKDKHNSCKASHNQISFK